MSNEIKEILEAKRAEILKIAARHGAHNVRVFGSVARGDSAIDSDIDFLIQMENNRKRSAGIQAKYRRTYRVKPESFYPRISIHISYF